MEPARGTAQPEARSPLENLDPQGISVFLNQLSAIQAHINKSNGGPSQDPASPFYLHPSENPGISITHEILNGRNYGDWSRAMNLALKSKNKLRFIDGSLDKPEKHDPLFEAWDRCNTYVVGWINRSLEPDIAKSVSWNTIALDLWEDLKHRYYQGDRFRIAELQEELYATKQGEMSVTVYFTKLKTIWEDLDSFRAIPSCKCGRNCSCRLGVIRDFRTEDQVTRFLRGLNEQYAGVRLQVMLMDPLPNINTVFSLLTQQERQFQSFDFVSEPRLIAQTSTQPATLLNIAGAFQGRGRGRGRGGKNPGFGRGQGGRGKMQCSHCGKTGHVVDTCYKKHGLSPHLKQRYNTAFTNMSAAEFDSEGSNENLRNPYNGQDSDVTSLDFTPKQKSALLALLSKEAQKPSQNADPHKEPLPTPHPGKLEHIMHFTSNILALNISDKKFASWVIDTGATDHVSYSLNDFHTYHEIAPILVKLPNGVTAQTTR
ncbi:uncharacterized protein LOC130980703 [Arachis stenosperma]|uniref:uncharacterized protein LOC130980703 n=1 Tax=Arachis stenosperma TaxID=217475 RepID=UPI0025AC8F9E|nr:uncharacterized protein LOC130980703 [Arachis stenosperma]